VRLAVVAAIRHEDTRYDEFLMRGVARDEAREIVRPDIDRIVRGWRTNHSIDQPDPHTTG
jgi:hypothetical protein